MTPLKRNRCLESIDACKANALIEHRFGIGMLITPEKRPSHTQHDSPKIFPRRFAYNFRAPAHTVPISLQPGSRAAVYSATFAFSGHCELRTRNCELSVSPLLSNSCGQVTQNKVLAVKLVGQMDENKQVLCRDGEGYPPPPPPPPWGCETGAGLPRQRSG